MAALYRVRFVHGMHADSTADELPYVVQGDLHGLKEGIRSARHITVLSLVPLKVVRVCVGGFLWVIHLGLLTCMERDETKVSG